MLLRRPRHLAAALTAARRPGAGLGGAGLGQLTAVVAVVVTPLGSLWIHHFVSEFFTLHQISDMYARAKLNLNISTKIKSPAIIDPPFKSGPDEKKI